MSFRHNQISFFKPSILEEIKLKTLRLVVYPTIPGGPQLRFKDELVFIYIHVPVGIQLFGGSLR